MEPHAAKPEREQQRPVLDVIRTTAPFAYCDACLALRCHLSLTAIEREPDTQLVRRPRACDGCGRTQELSAPRE